MTATHPFEQLFYIYDAGHRFGSPDSVYTPGRWPLPRVRPATPPVVTREKVAASFYMPEIVDAALVITVKAHRAGTYDIGVTLDDFEAPTGFLHLLNYGSIGIFGGAAMLRANPGNPREFRPTDSFWDRVVGMAQESEKT